MGTSLISFVVMAGRLTGLGGFNNTSLPWPLNPQGILQKLPHTTLDHPTAEGRSFQAL
jgi:hypothetical protein